MTQTELAKAAGIGRHAVSYWECKVTVDRCAWAVKRMFNCLPLPDYPASNARAIQADRIARMTGGVAVSFPIRYRQISLPPPKPARCGAKTRKGTPCRCQPEPGKARCKFHGGRSTGAKTAEGRERIAEAQRRRWARWRAERDCNS